MNEELIKEVSLSLNIKSNNAKSVLTLLSDGNTVPFIARYRKEATGGLDEEQIRAISIAYEYMVSLESKKESTQRLIEEKGMLTDEIIKNIKNAKKLVELDDIYKPFKEKRKTKGIVAINKGLEPLAKIIMSFPTIGSLEDISSKYISQEVPSTTDAVEGAGHIIAEWISDNAYYIKSSRDFIFKNANIVTKLKKDAIDENKVYEMYYSFTERVAWAKSYRVLAINRAEKEKVISVSVDYEKGRIYDYL